jgi:hypothetical protein
MLSLGMGALAQDSRPADPAAPAAPAGAAALSPPAAGGAISGANSAEAHVPEPLAPADSNDPLLQPPPLPPGKPTLIGGTITRIDKVRDTLTLKPFGGGAIKVFFDDRTHIFRDGIEATVLSLRKGDRVYVDTILNGPRVFARNIRMGNGDRLADARGQILAYDARKRRLQMRDSPTAEPVAFRVTGDTVIRQIAEAPGAGTSELVAGSLVVVRFSPAGPNQDTAREVDVYAVPGSVFTFAGTVTFLNLAHGVVALQQRSDDQNYEIMLERGADRYTNLTQGAEVTIRALFDGERYLAQSIEVTGARSSANP